MAFLIKARNETYLAAEGAHLGSQGGFARVWTPERENAKTFETHEAAEIVLLREFAFYERQIMGIEIIETRG